jgi:hypothetical protein
MYINIITPCSRPENLHKISKSINFPKENYRWIVVFDSLTLPDKNIIPENCEYYLHKDPNSISGNGQRNFALNLVKTGYIYFNDDDTLIHPELWDNVKDCTEDFISFNQSLHNGYIRLTGDIIKVQQTDSHNFMISSNTGMNFFPELLAKPGKIFSSTSPSFMVIDSIFSLMVLFGK